MKWKTVLQLNCLILLSGIIFSCTKKPNNDGAIPKISYTGISGDSIKAGSPQIIALEFSFSDGNGDLGNSTSSGNYDIYTIDSRDSAQINYYFPKNMKQYSDPTYGLSGSCQVGLLGSFMLLRPDHPTRDTVRYEVYIKDRAGNESNHFFTPDIYIVQ